MASELTSTAVFEAPPPRTAEEARIRAAELWSQQVRLLLAYCEMRDLAERMAAEEHERWLSKRDLREAQRHYGKSVRPTE